MFFYEETRIRNRISFNYWNIFFINFITSNISVCIAFSKRTIVKKSGKIALVISSKAVKGLYYSASFALSVNEPDPLISDASSLEMAKRRSKLSCGFMRYAGLSLISIGGMVCLMYFQSALYDASEFFVASALLRYVLVFGGILVASIVFQILSHRKVR